MKKTLLAAFLVASSMSIFTSCNEKSRLADNITGSWTGQAERVEVPDSKTTTTVTRSFIFTTDDTSSTGGDISATALFSVESGTQLEAAGTQPIAVTVNGSATITGHWEAIDDDEVMVSFDPNSLKIDINPNEVVLEYNIATEESSPIEEATSTQVAQAVTKSIKPLLQQRVFNYSKIKDIKIKGVLMSCELDKKDYTLRRDE